MPNPLELEPAVFRAQFPAFPNPPFTDAALQVQWDIAILYVSNSNCGTLMDAFRSRAIYLMMAHLMRLGELMAADGGTGTPGIVTQATIDKVSVTMQPPPAGDSWKFWLNQTPYGQQLLAFLSLHSIGGFYAVGMPELGPFRRVGGIHFPGGQIF